MTRTCSIAVVVASASMLGGCGIYLESDQGSLPDLSPAEQALNDARLTEVALTASVPVLDAATAEGCAECAELASRLRDGSAERLATLGGEWNPWPDGTPPGAETPPAPDPVPSSARELAKAAVSTAVRDMSVTIDDATGRGSDGAASDRHTLVALAAGRLAWGLDLAAALNIGDDEVATWAREAFATATSADQDSRRDAEKDTGRDLTDTNTATVVSQVVRQWDCGAQVLPVINAAPNTESGMSDGEARALQVTDDLLTTVTATLAIDGVQDLRLPSCVGAFEQHSGTVTGNTAIGRMLVAADLQLIAADSTHALMATTDPTGLPLGVSRLVKDLTFLSHNEVIPPIISADSQG